MKLFRVLLVTALVAPLFLTGCCCPDKKDDCCYDKTSGNYSK